MFKKRKKLQLKKKETPKKKEKRKRKLPANYIRYAKTKNKA